jgi:hypothetical protein
MDTNRCGLNEVSPVLTKHGQHCQLGRWQSSGSIPAGFAVAAPQRPDSARRWSSSPPQAAQGNAWRWRGTPRSAGYGACQPPELVRCVGTFSRPTTVMDDPEAAPPPGRDARSRTVGSLKGNLRATIQGSASARADRESSRQERRAYPGRATLDDTRFLVDSASGAGPLGRRAGPSLHPVLDRAALAPRPPMGRGPRAPGSLSLQRATIAHQARGRQGQISLASSDPMRVNVARSPGAGTSAQPIRAMASRARARSRSA